MPSTNARTLPTLVSAATTRRARWSTTARSHKVLRTQPSAPLPHACEACDLRSVGDLPYLPGHGWPAWSMWSLLLRRLARRRASFKDGRHSDPVHRPQALAPCPRTHAQREGHAPDQRPQSRYCERVMSLPSSWRRTLCPESGADVERAQPQS